MKLEDKAYTAGLIDGEGTVALTQHHSNEHRYPSLIVPSTTYVFLSFLKDTFGGSISSKRSKAKHHSPSWAWEVRANRALNVLRIVLPFMKEPEKIRRVKMLLVGYKAVTAANGKYTSELIKKRKQFEREFFSRSRKYARQS